MTGIATGASGEPDAGAPRGVELCAGRITTQRIWLWLMRLWRYPLRRLYRAWGSLRRRVTLKGWWPLAKVFLIVVGILFAVPVVLHWLVSGFNSTGLAKKWGVAKAPDVKDWLTPLNVAVLFVVTIFMRWLSQARERVVVEGFVDHTTEDATAVKGLSDMLVTELARLRELYRRVNAGAVPTAVGVERQGGFARGKEAAPFLSVTADDVTDVLEGAVASDARVELGPAKIPIGPILGVFNRMVRGPRIIASVHRTEAGGGPTLTAQLVGGNVVGTWRVDQEHEPESAAQRKAFLDTMVRELACRIFTELTLGASVRWQAVQAFNEYLRLYGESRTRPRDRARYLKLAQGKLLEAVAEDETFQLAYYNLGVTYMQLAQAELNTERSSDDLTSPAGFNRRQLDQTRKEAAKVAFTKATEKKPEAWEGHYALAVTMMSEITIGVEHKLWFGDERALRDNDPTRRDEQPTRRDDQPTLRDDEPTLRDDEWTLPHHEPPLRDVVRRCRQALAVGPPKPAAASVHDLMGMAQTRLGEYGPAVSSHRKAVKFTWMELCRAEREQRALPEVSRERLDRATVNAVAALHNVGLARMRRAETHFSERHSSAETDQLLARIRAWRAEAVRTRDRRAAARMFKVAIDVAGEGTASAAAAQFERGRALEECRKFREAERSYVAAARIHPANPEYLACRARCLARWAKDTKGRLLNNRRSLERNTYLERARDVASRALDTLAPDFARSVIPFTPKALAVRCDKTLATLAQAYRELDAATKADCPRKDELGADVDTQAANRMKTIAELRRELEEKCNEVSVSDGTRLDEAIKELQGYVGRWCQDPRLHELIVDRDQAQHEVPESGHEWELFQVALALSRLYVARLAQPDRGKVSELLHRLIKWCESSGHGSWLVGLSVGAQYARSLRLNNQPVKALTHAAQTVRAEPLDIDARREAGLAHFDLGQYTDALDAWQHALFLNPSDAYLHFQIGMCHRRMADQCRGGNRTTDLDQAVKELTEALALFDGEDLEGAAWTRVWLGRIALERGRGEEAIRWLAAARHGQAGLAAALFLGEAYLMSGRFMRAESVLDEAREAIDCAAGDEGREPLDADWGDELPRSAFEARWLRASADAMSLAADEWQCDQDAVDVVDVVELLRDAERYAIGIADHRIREACLAPIYRSRARMLRSTHRLDDALAEIRNRLRIDQTPEDFALNAELLELRDAGATTSPSQDRWLAAEYAWHAAEVDPSNGAPNETRLRRERLRRAIRHRVPASEDE
jgi:tetratricopeptide (TPR) repeat protein